jgi:Zn-dependent protease with chaperone function
MNDPAAAGDVHVVVERWPSELPLLALVILASLSIWALLALTIVGAIYALFIGLVLFLAHLGFVAHLRGSAVRLGPAQFPELHARVEAQAQRLGLKQMPEAYLMQAGGALNALATRFLRSHMIVLFSDLLDACGDNDSARDMIIGHELGHIRAGHLRWQWFLAPGLFLPFLGSAYSQAREYTCDRYGMALSRDRMRALPGHGHPGPGAGRAAHGLRVGGQPVLELLGPGQPGRGPRAVCPRPAGRG